MKKVAFIFFGACQNLPIIDDRVTVVVLPDQEGIDAARVVLVCGGSGAELGK